MILANMTNGLVYPHTDICYFQSCYGHHASYGYFRVDAMPLKAIVRLLTGGWVKIIDATARDKELSDALKYGVPTWCLVFNRAIRQRNIKVCDWQTPAMVSVANSNKHKATVQTIRKLLKIYNYTMPAIIGQNVMLECHKLVSFDDKPEMIKNIVTI
jgi:hypothetical protein